MLTILMMPVCNSGQVRSPRLTVVGKAWCQQSASLIELFAVDSHVGVVTVVPLSAGLVRDSLHARAWFSRRC